MLTTHYQAFDAHAAANLDVFALEKKKIYSYLPFSGANRSIPGSSDGCQVFPLVSHHISNWGGPLRPQGLP